MNLTRVVHTQSTMNFGELSALTPDLTFQSPVGETPRGLAFLDPDGTVHVYVLDSEGVRRLQALLSGLVIAGNGKPV